MIDTNEIQAKFGLDSRSTKKSSFLWNKALFWSLGARFDSGWPGSMLLITYTYIFSFGATDGHSQYRCAGDPLSRTRPQTSPQIQPFSRVYTGLNFIYSAPFSLPCFTSNHAMSALPTSGFFGGGGSTSVWSYGCIYIVDHPFKLSESCFGLQHDSFFQ
jgi:hypothetical protein